MQKAAADKVKGRLTNEPGMIDYRMNHGTKQLREILHHSGNTMDDSVDDAAANMISTSLANAAILRENGSVYSSQKMSESQTVKSRTLNLHGEDSTKNQN
jgi:hypothetical protein